MVDVAVIGAGPSGLIAAALLGRGHSVAVIERQQARYSLPRAGHVDHEIMRILQSLDGAQQPIIDDQYKVETYNWVNAAGETILSFPFGAPSVSGFQSDYMMYQPVLENAVYEAIEGAAKAPVVKMGWEVVAIDQDDDGVLLTARRREVDADGNGFLTADELTVRASYVLAADGARSPARTMLGIGQHDYGFSERWLDVDVRIKRPLPQEMLDLGAFQVCDPARPTLLTSLGKRHYRFEWMLFDDESAEEFEAPEKSWELISRWNLTNEDIEPLRRLVYTFESKIAKHWRSGNVFILGDAAHTMPPHMGQGMCSGVRDSANLAWKLDLVLRGIADQSLLDTYEPERRPHSDAWVLISKEVGEVSCMTDPVQVAERDAGLARGEMPPAPEFPTLTAGVLELDEAGVPVAPAGELFLQAEVKADGRSGLFHDVIGQGFQLVSGAGDPRPLLSSEARDLLERLDVTVSWLAAEGEDLVDGAFADPTGQYGEYFAAQGAVLVRPDYYIFGTVADLDDLPALVQQLAVRLSVSDLLPR
jgi:2-polyprenyl-6-methoxyphenol hydroxylase-like FAD-dependent oxidoreductase